MNTQEKEKRVQALKALKKLMTKTINNRVYASVVSVSRSGMSRTITFRIITNKGELLNINSYIHNITGYSWDSWQGLRVSGCGMDMIFNTLYVVNGWAINYGVVRKSKKKSEHDLVYNGLVNTNYYSL